MRDDNKKQRRLVTILIAVIVVLLLVMAYFFLIKPGINKFAYNKQVEGMNYAYANLISQIQQNNYFALPLGTDEQGQNKTLVLVPYVPPQDQTPAE
jgi:ABC-type dipeptide/oligopeptide/nickel transport system permease subunit